MLCRRCGILGDPVRLKWWHKAIPTARRYYCAGCGRTYLALFEEAPKTVTPGSTGRRPPGSVAR